MAIRYGVTQALLDAVATAQGRLMCQVVAEEYNLPLSARPVSIFAQSGDDRYANVDKMILKKIEVLPHGLINDVKTKLGRKGEKFEDYVRWIRDRVFQLRMDDSYHPILHFDLYGTLGLAFERDVKLITDYLVRLASLAEPFELQIEAPVDMGDRESQCQGFGRLKKELRSRDVKVRLVADEWCNTLDDIKYFADQQAVDMIQIKTPDLGGIQNSIEAILYCRERNVGAYMGGSANETDQSARICAQIALASQPDQMLAKPGLGVDEGFMIVFNEMQRCRAILGKRGAIRNE